MMMMMMMNRTIVHKSNNNEISNFPSQFSMRSKKVPLDRKQHYLKGPYRPFKFSSNPSTKAHYYHTSHIAQFFPTCLLSPVFKPGRQIVLLITVYCEKFMIRRKKTVPPLKIFLIFKLI